VVFITGAFCAPQRREAGLCVQAVLTELRRHGSTFLGARLRLAVDSRKANRCNRNPTTNRNASRYCRSTRQLFVVTAGLGTSGTATSGQGLLWWVTSHLPCAACKRFAVENRTACKGPKRSGSRKPGSTAFREGQRGIILNAIYQDEV
jgi:hypothetical protein